MKDSLLDRSCLPSIWALLLLFASAFPVAGAPEEPATVHDEILSQASFPSAKTCKSCHPTHYTEWSVSSHAYAQMSPFTIGLQAAVTRLTNGTNGDFCIRCHNQVGMYMNESIFMPNQDRHPTSREGVTCVVCHRRKDAYGKVDGRFGLTAGDQFEPVYGPNGNEELQRVIESGDFSVNTQPGEEGRDIHRTSGQLPQISTSGFCGSCHDVTLVTGFRLEEAFSEYKASPASKEGVSCQDCHMGKEPGVPAGYFHEPVAIVGGKPTKARKRTNHMFIGPDSSVLHPGIFPHNPAASEFATIPEWLEYDLSAGWGTDEFEDYVSQDHDFPARWTDIAERYEARALIDENLALLQTASVERERLLRAGYQMGSIIVERADREGIAFEVEVKNGTKGHNVPTGFDAERLVFLRVTVVDATGTVVLRSGDLDPNGDLRDSHSIYVRNGELPKDEHLFNLQSKFLVRMAHGGEREQVLPINHSLDPLPFVRPTTRSTLLVGRPPGVRKHRMSIAPLGSRWARYEVKGARLAESTDPYRARIQLIAGMVPVNLIHALKDAGFDDYGISPRAAADAVVAAHITLWERDVILSPSSTGEAGLASQDDLIPMEEVATSGGKGQGAARGAREGRGELGSRMPDHVVPIESQVAGFPERPKPLVELGDPLLDTGPVSLGFEIPTGAIWQPSFLVWGEYRTAVQTFYDGKDDTLEWTNRADLFAQIGLTQTERVVMGFRVLDREGRSTGYTFSSPDRERGFQNELNSQLTTLFVEGDFGELFPRLDEEDGHGLDVGFSVGRQPLIFQQGLLIKDNIDALGLTKINLRTGNVINHRSTFVWGWNELNRTNLTVASGSSSLLGWFNEIDWRSATGEFDLIYVGADDQVGRGVYFGLASTQRLGEFNTAFRLLGSTPVGKEILHNSRGLLFFSEVSRTVAESQDLVYLNSFLGLDHFRSASRDPLEGGPLSGRAGILFESVDGLALYPSPLSNSAEEAIGGAFGYQKFFAGNRRQLILELGGRYATNNEGQRAFGLGSRYQAAIRRRGILLLNTYLVYDQRRDSATSNLDELRYGARVELRIKF